MLFDTEKYPKGRGFTGAFGELPVAVSLPGTIGSGESGGKRIGTNRFGPEGLGRGLLKTSARVTQNDRSR